MKCWAARGNMGFYGLKYIKRKKTIIPHFSEQLHRRIPYFPIWCLPKRNLDHIYEIKHTHTPLHKYMMCNNDNNVEKRKLAVLYRRRPTSCSSVSLRGRAEKPDPQLTWYPVAKSAVIRGLTNPTLPAEWCTAPCENQFFRMQQFNDLCGWMYSSTSHTAANAYSAFIPPLEIMWQKQTSHFTLYGISAWNIRRERWTQ